MYTNEKGFIGEIPGRYIVISAGFGKWSPADVEDLCKAVLLIAKSFGKEKWGYIADPSRLYPIVAKETSEAFIKLHQRLETEGCCAIAFLDSNAPSMKLLSQMHQNDSKTAIEVLHFEKEEQALEWMKELGL
jgi:hypothetical protein